MTTPATHSSQAGPTADDSTDDTQWAAWTTDCMRRRMVAFALRYVGDSWEAEDVVQETLLRARDSLPSLRTRDRGEAWLFRICRHAAIDHVRSRRVRRVVWAPMPGGEVRAPDSTGAQRSSARAGGGPAEMAGHGRQQHSRPFRELPLRTLPAHQRVLVSLHYEQGVPQARLCSMTGLSPSALRVRLFRARLALLATVRSASPEGA